MAKGAILEDIYIAITAVVHSIMLITVFIFR